MSTPYQLSEMNDFMSNIRETCDPTLLPEPRLSALEEAFFSAIKHDDIPALYKATKTAIEHVMKGDIQPFDPKNGSFVAAMLAEMENLRGSTAQLMECSLPDDAVSAPDFTRNVFHAGFTQVVDVVGSHLELLYRRNLPLFPQESVRREISGKRSVFVEGAFAMFGKASC